MGSHEASTQKKLFSKCRRLRKDGFDEKATHLLSDALRCNQLDAEGILHAGRMLRILNDGSDTKRALSISILGQCTTTWLGLALTAVAHGHGHQVSVEEEEYDNVFQGIESLASNVDAVILVPWSQRLFGDADRDLGTRVNDELDFWQGIWSAASRRANTRVIQVGYDWLDAGASGHHLGASNGGDIGLIRELNSRLRDSLPAGAFFVDLEQISGTIGRELFYDQRRYYWTKQPFSDAGVVRLAKHVWCGIRATTVGPKKVLVLDLDNTLWGGVVGELGPLGIELNETPAGEAYRDFQRLVKGLADRGCVLAVCSKNNPDDAREPFIENPDMILRLDDIAAFEASWESKAIAIQRISSTLKLGLDSFVFFDDEPAEREEIRQALPEVEVVDVPDDPADYRQALLSGLWFESSGITEEDRLRTEQYRSELYRSESQTLAGSVDEYLQSLEMTAQVDPVEESNLDRVVQLIGKTNQFNLTTRRHTREAVSTLLVHPATIALALRMQDRFGDYGLVSVIIAADDSRGDERRLRIDSWLMSCRVIGRTAEQFFFNNLLEEARTKKISVLLGDYIPSKKNAVVAGLYESLGFAKCGGARSGNVHFELDIAKAVAANTFVGPASIEK